ncbi:MAG TPA: acylphosphatase [Sphingomicrobium sp.]
MIARRVRVTGRVQGVFFRAWTRDEARSLQVSGWVRNSSDGSVEAHVEGDEPAVNELVDRLREGPPHARVDRVDLSDAAVEGLKTFDVRH